MTQYIDQNDGDEADQVFAGKFYYRFCVPVACKKLQDAPHIHEVNKLDFSNRVLLEVLNTSTPSFSGTSELDNETQQFLSTLGAKLDLLLRWTGQLMTDKLNLPPQVDVDLNAHGIKLVLESQHQELDLAERNLIEIYICERYPEPLRLFTRLLGSERSDHGYSYSFKIENCGDETQDALERYIFKVHRQYISSLKKRSHCGVEE